MTKGLGDYLIYLDTGYVFIIGAMKWLVRKVASYSDIVPINLANTITN